MPARNESGRIGSVIQSVRQVLPGADVVVVNDDSSDTTQAEATDAGATVLPHPVNLGYGAGLETGYTYALREGYEWVLQMDADGQHLAEELPRVLQPLLCGRADIVLGSRFMPGQSAYAAGPIRRLGQRFFGLLLRGLTGRRFTDPTSGFQALNRAAVEFLASGVFPCDYPDADVLLMSHRAGLRIAEVPVRMRTRDGGTSMHSGLKPLYYGIKMLFSLFIVLLNFGVWRAWQRATARRTCRPAAPHPS
jgi:glycosyltransferase involved in cell wall biosynthesis